MGDDVRGGGVDDVEMVLEHELGLAVAADQDEGVDVRQRRGQRGPVVVVGHGAGEADHLDPVPPAEQLHDLAAEPSCGTGHRDPGHPPIIQCAAPR